MEKIAVKTFNQISKLVTTTTTPNDRNIKSARRNKEKDQQPNEKTASPTKQPTVSPKNAFILKEYKNIQQYHPFQKQNKLTKHKAKVCYQQIEQQHTHRIQNKHSFFLNSRNPRPPLYQRAQQIVEERQMILGEKRKLIQRLKQQKEQEEYQKFMAQVPSKKTISRHQAQKMSERLYKEHYSKLNRLNHQKMQRLKQETKAFRQKPQISQMSKQLFSILKNKEHLQKDVFNRFENYNVEQTKKQAEVAKRYKDKYFPFKPIINQTSKLLTEGKPKRQELSRNKHCTSCLWIKHSKSKLDLTYSPQKTSTSPLKFSLFQ